MSTPDNYLSRWLLVNYAGYPYTPSSLMPDNGLANLAAVLTAAGARAGIVDYATVGILSRFTSPTMARHLARVWERAAPKPGKRLGPAAKAAALASLQYGEMSRRRRQKRLLRELAAELVARVEQQHIQAVGFKLWNGDGIEGSAVLAQELRRSCPGVALFAGGPQVDVFMEKILEHFDVFHALVYGEGEETIVRLAEAGGDRSAYAGIPNLIYREDGHVRRTPPRFVADLDTLPMPLYGPDVYPAMRGDEKIRIMVIDESRGCGNNCAFCIHPVKSDRRLRVKSIPRLLEELRRMASAHGTRAFRFAGSCTPYELLDGVAQALPREPVRYRFASFAHVRHAAAVDFAALHAAGCVALFFGVESGSAEILKGMRKGTDPAMILNTLRAAGDAGIFTVAGVIFPAPGETPASRDATLRLLCDARPGAVTVTPPIVMPRTDWFESSDKYGIHIRNRNTCLDETMGWKVKFLLPPAFWKELPLTINGLSYRRILRQTTEITRLVEAEGMDTAITDEACLMSTLAGMTPRAFRDEARSAFFCGDGARARALVERINAAV